MSEQDTIVESLEDKVAEKIKIGIEKNIDPHVTARTVLRVVDSHKSDFMTRKDAARYLTTKGYPISAKRLANMASNNNAGNGPKFTQTAWSKVVYNRIDLDEWLRARQRKIDCRTSPPLHLTRRLAVQGQ